MTVSIWPLDRIRVAPTLKGSPPVAMIVGVGFIHEMSWKFESLFQMMSLRSFRRTPTWDPIGTVKSIVVGL